MDKDSFLTKLKTVVSNPFDSSNRCYGYKPCHDKFKTG